MPQPHKHKDLIIAWANGAVIEGRVNSSFPWVVVNNPSWKIDVEYRVRPKGKVKKYRFVFSYIEEPQRFFISSSFYVDKKEFLKRNQHVAYSQRIDASLIEVEE